MNLQLLIALVTFLGSTIRVVSGLGGATIMVAALITFLPIDQAILLSAVIHWFNALCIVGFFWKGLHKRLILFFAVPGVLTAFVGAQFITVHDPHWFNLFLGIILISYVLFVFLKPKFRLSESPLILIGSGSLSGFLKSIFGIGGGINAVVLTAFDVEKTTYLATGGAISVVLDTARLLAYWFYGATLETSLQYGLLVFIPLSLAGSLVGRAVVGWIPQHQFRKVVLIALAVMGIWLLVS
jgi:uncharacterized protein